MPIRSRVTKHTSLVGHCSTAVSPKGGYAFLKVKTALPALDYTEPWNHILGLIVARAITRASHGDYPEASPFGKSISEPLLAETIESKNDF